MESKLPRRYISRSAQPAAVTAAKPNCDMCESDWNAAESPPSPASHDIEDLLRANMVQVLGSRCNRAMAELFRDEADFYPFLPQFAGTTVPESMRVAALGDIRLPTQTLHQSADIGRRERSASESTEDRLRRVDAEGSTSLQPPLKNGPCARIKPDDAGLIALAMQNPHAASPRVEVFWQQGEGLRDSQRRSVQDSKECPIANTGRPHATRLHEAHHFGKGKGFDGELDAFVAASHGAILFQVVRVTLLYESDTLSKVITYRSEIHRNTSILAEGRVDS